MPRSRQRHNFFGFSGICVTRENVSLVFNGLQKCLKNRQWHEPGGIPRKFAPPEIFSAELSPETGDSFALASALCSVQP
jgi:hypothetical protein